MKTRLTLAALCIGLFASAQSVSTGLYHSFATCADGTVMAFGRNDMGQLGIGNTDQQNTPVQVSGLSGIVEAEAGRGYFSVFLTAEGTVWMSGSNAYGNFGNNATSSSNPEPFLVSMTGMVDVAAGFGHTVLLDEAGSVWTSGWGNQGQLGSGSFSNSLVFNQVTGLPQIIQVEAGYWHTLLLASDGTVWAMGSNNLGQLGEPQSVPYSNVPIQVSGLSNIVQISAGSYYSMFLSEDHEVFACGSNPNGQLALGNYLNQFGVAPCIGLPDIAYIEAGNEHSMFLDFTGHVWGVGFSNFGQNGLGATTNTPALIDELSNVISVSACGDGNAGTTLFLKESGAMWGCGSGGSGQLGVPNVPYYATPQFLSGVCGSNLPVADLLADEYILCNEIESCFHLLDYSLNAENVIWNFGPSGTPNEQNEFTVDVCYSEPGTYEVSIEVVNDFGSDFDTVTLTLTSLPEIIVPEFDTLYCLPADAGVYDLTGFLPEGGFFSGPGINLNTFDPTVAGFGIHTLSYSVTNAPGCEDTETFEVEVSTCQLPIVNLYAPDEFCMSDTCITVTSEALYCEETEWSVPGATEESYQDLIDYILCYPSPGTYEISFTGHNAYGSTTASVEIEVIENPSVSLNLTEDVACTGPQTEIIVLGGGEPAGGVFSGTGVAINDFDAEELGPGEYIITYTYTENGCSGSATDTMFVEICDGIREIHEMGFSVSPNFGSGPFFLTLNDPALIGSDIVISDASGRVVHRGRVTAMRQQIVSRQLGTDGIYTIVISNGTSVESCKVLMQQE